MAMIYNQNIRNLWTGAGILGGSSNWDPFNAFSAIYAITVLSGVQPSAATITSNWTSYNTTYLCHWQSIYIYNPNFNTANTSQNIVLYGIPGSANANASGTASWGILWPTNPSEATIQGSSLPSTQFIVVPVTDIAGGGVVRLTSTSLTVGNPYSIADFVMVGGGGIA